MTDNFSHTISEDLMATTKSPSMLKRAAASAYLGSVIEYYDFFIYSVCAALVFKDIFFSNLPPLVGTLASLATFATGYLARPIGGIVFGHFGDKLGRKKMLVLTMTVMGISSTAIGFLPTYEQAGVIAPILLILIRVAQGVAIGGEWGGAVLMSAEHSTKNRGFWASFTNAGGPSGTLASSLVVTVTMAVMGVDDFIAWGWRLPFLASILLLVVGMIVRAKVDESPEFLLAQERKRTSAEAPTTIPIFATLRRQPLTLVLSIGVGLSAFIFQGLLTTYSVAYGVQVGVERQTILNALSITSFTAIIGVLVWSRVSDAIGRRPLVIAGAVLIAVWGFVLFPIIDTRSGVLIAIGMVVGGGIIHPMIYGPLAGLYTELFDTEHRYTGASLGYQLAGMGAGISPVLFAGIMSSNGGDTTIPLSLLIAGFAVISVLCILKLGETSTRSLSDVTGGSTGKSTHSPATTDVAKTASTDGALP
ncbi:sugar phosphate permease [Brevibacterium sanguinis]|uniref:Sugar phosphate permease n=2 Tax=Brevibacterium TaxID=1696 RepID=A0A366IJV9_9MICO|nr:MULTISPECIES: MFS transporter [Brevibacterium]RBP66062.1 sugar phosphate permease [Brevibacterium sanguinis]RBP72713.1 sugar phosphate permease [Brevibacterium celere]